ncbi:exodeoxyribonuclease V, partial [Streptomyces tateyamensis]
MRSAAHWTTSRRRCAATPIRTGTSCELERTVSQTPDPAGDPAPEEPAVPEPRTSRSADLAALTEAIRAVERRTGPAQSAGAARSSGAAPSEGASPSGGGAAPGAAAGGSAGPDSAGPGSVAPGSVAPGSAAPASSPGAAPPSAAGAPSAAAASARVAVDASSLAELLTAGGAPTGAVPALAAAAAAAFGEAATETLRDDPWALLALPGVRPEQADGFARTLLGPAAGPGDPRRGQALAVWLLEQAALRGHSAQPAGELQQGLAGLGVPEPEQALQEAVTEGRLLAFQELEPGHHAVAEDEEPPTRLLLALERLAMAEDAAAEGLVRLISTFEPRLATAPGLDEAEAELDGSDPGFDAVDAAATEAEAGSDKAGSGEAEAGSAEAEAGSSPVGAEPGGSWEQAAAAASPSGAALIRAVAASGLVLHTGDAAARSELAELLAAARGLGLRARAAAWTEHGRAALADPDSLTLDQLLGPGGVDRAVDGTLELDLLIVQDAPLLDLERAATLVEALADATRLVLSGDPAQLWSAGPGRLFADLLAAKACPQVASRTPDLGPIGELVSGIGIGELNAVEAPDKEVVILTARDAGEAVHRAVQLLTDSIPRALGIPVEQTVLITPGHGGAAGTRALNAAAKAKLNPGPGRFGGFDPGDRVVHSPLPGVSHPGTVLGGEPGGLRVALADGTELLLPPDGLAGLRHGWALTAHQALGRRWPGAVVVLPEDAAAGLTR